MRLTINQRTALLHMLFHNGISYADEYDRTNVSLAKRGLIVWCHRRKYGRSHWSLTDAGCAVAKPWAAPTTGAK